MADVAALKQKLIDTGMALMDIAQAAAAAGAATAGLPAALPSGMARPKQNLSDAGALASQTQQTMQAVYNCADALAKLETAFPPASPPTTP
jgi:hypothetical protein